MYERAVGVCGDVIVAVESMTHKTSLIVSKHRLPVQKRIITYSTVYNLSPRSTLESSIDSRRKLMSKAAEAAVACRALAAVLTVAQRVQYCLSSSMMHALRMSIKTSAEMSHWRTHQLRHKARSAGFDLSLESTPLALFMFDRYL